MAGRRCHPPNKGRSPQEGRNISYQKVRAMRIVEIEGTMRASQRIVKERNQLI